MDDAEILLTGWGIRDRHETINSFHWGPDGWLYFPIDIDCNICETARQPINSQTG